MEKHFKKIFFVLLGIILIPIFANAKTVSDLISADISCSAGTSVAKNSTANWSITGIDELVNPTISWSGSGVSGSEETSVTTYSTAGTINDVVVTIADESGSIEVACDSLSVTGSSGGGSSGGGSVGNTCKIVGNVDGDDACDVDILDFNILALNWGSTVSGNVADLNNDRIVNILDFNILALNWTGSL